MICFLKAIVFYPLMFLRPFLKFILRILGGFLLFGSILGFIFGQAANHKGHWIMLGASFATFVFGSIYDLILMRLNPHDTILILSD
jgi:hypothetical protein